MSKDQSINIQQFTGDNFKYDDDWYATLLFVITELTQGILMFFY